MSPNNLAVETIQPTWVHWTTASSGHSTKLTDEVLQVLNTAVHEGDEPKARELHISHK